MQFSGWLFDVYPNPTGMTLWLLDEAGNLCSGTYPYQPSFYLTGSWNRLKDAQQWFFKQQISLQTDFVEKREFYSNDIVPSLKVKVANPLHYVPLVQRVLRLDKGLEPATCDIPLPQLFFIETGLFPLCRLTSALDDSGTLREFHLLDSPVDMDYLYPPLRVLQLRVEGENFNPAHGRKSPLIAEFEGRQLVLEEPCVVDELNRLLKTFDPHLLLTEWGDSFLVPRLLKLAARQKKTIHWDRDPHGKLKGLKGRSYFTYGKVVYVAPEVDFCGRWHIDRINSFIVHESGLEGLFELARLAKIPIQRIARVSTGTCISAMQLEVAIRENYLVPYRKHQAEEFKTAEELLVIDKGGLTFQPVLGMHEEVAELDFSSMYPTIMTQFNLSPETLDCLCCPEAPRVPEARYRVCQKRLGLIPKTLKAVLAKRTYYKYQKKHSSDPVIRAIADRKQCALKWLLVTCFGYLGYKNARFGKIEAHESTTAYGREMLLQAKEYVEARDFQLIHALTDSLWIRRPGTSPQEYEALAQRLSQLTTIPISFEGIFQWISFVPSRQNRDKPVPNRYFGVYENGELKLRGIESRRSDSPRFVQQVQRQMLEILSHCPNLEACSQVIPSLFGILAAALDALQSGQVAFEDLVVNRRLSQDPLSYEKANVAAIASQQLLSRGIPLNPGERVQFVYLKARSRISAEKVRAYSLLDGTCHYDVEKYAELLLKSAESLLIHFGWTFEKLQAEIIGGDQKQKKTKEIPAPRAGKRKQFAECTLPF
jgi:DNA polymerase II